MDLISLESLTKRYGSRIGVESLSLGVPAGSMFGFLGPNGAGKTTTIRVLLGFLAPTSGRASILGSDCWTRSPVVKRDVGYLPGDLRLPSWMNCNEAFSMFSRIRRCDLRRVGRELADAFGLDTALRVRAMSRGTRQKLGLVLALAHQPQLLILDEPTASLDPLVQQTLYAKLREAVAAGRTVLLSSHTLSEVEELCSHVAILRLGKLAACDRIDRLRESARRRVTVRWRQQPPGDVAAWDGVEWTNRDGDQWSGVLRGESVDFARWVAGQPIADVCVEAPNLGDIFQKFYS